MPDWASEFLTGGLSQGLMVPWNWCMMVAYQLMGYQFEFQEGSVQNAFGNINDFFGGMSMNSIQDIYGWFLSAGLVLLNLFVGKRPDYGKMLR